MTKVRRAQDLPADDDGVRVLVDRYRPRGVVDASIDEWCLEVAPSPALIAWYGHKPERWEEFTRRYADELRRPDAQAALERLRHLAGAEGLTLLTGARDRERNPARFLAQLLGSTSTNVPARRPTPGSRHATPPGWRRAQLSSVLRWSWVVIGLTAPLLILFFSMAVDLWGRNGGIGVASFLALLCITTVIHTTIEERNMNRARGMVSAGGEGASLWAPLFDLGLSASGFLLGITVLVAGVLVLGQLHHYLH